MCVRQTARTTKTAIYHTYVQKKKPATPLPANTAGFAIQVQSVAASPCYTLYTHRHTPPASFFFSESFTMLQMSIKSLVVTTVLYVVGSHGYDCQEMSTMSDGYVCYCQSGCTGSCCGGQALIFGQYKDLASTSCRSCAGAIPTCEEGSGASYDDTNSICLCPYMTQGCSGNGCTESSFRDGSPVGFIYIYILNRLNRVLL